MLRLKLQPAIKVRKWLELFLNFVNKKATVLHIIKEWQKAAPENQSVSVSAPSRRLSRRSPFGAGSIAASYVTEVMS